MYWDVVEVKPEPNYALWVRFKDGLSGRVRLEPEEFTGVLAPLREIQFFNQVYIECGAVAWPGDIDLAPDAMYRRIAVERDRQMQVTARAQQSRGLPVRRGDGVFDRERVGNSPGCFENFEADDVSLAVIIQDDSRLVLIAFSGRSVA